MTREEARRAMFFAKREVLADSYIDKAYDMAIKALEEPEPSQVARDIATIIENEKDMRVISERKTGRWIRNDNGTWSCDNCHSWIPDEQHYYARFCLYCGAKMEVEHDESRDY